MRFSFESSCDRCALNSFWLSGLASRSARCSASRSSKLLRKNSAVRLTAVRSPPTSTPMVSNASRHLSESF